MPDDVEVTIVTMAFPAADPDQLLAILAKYVVVSRNHPGCRNIDLTRSMTQPNLYVIISKWESPDAQRAHFDSPEMVEMARACEGVLTGKPEIDLLEGYSAHDLV